MGTEIVGVLGLLVMLLLIALRVPVAIAMIAVAVAGYSYIVSPEAALARMGSEDALKRFQSQPHFMKFSGEIKARCEDGPHATKMSVVASTDS